MKITVIIPMYNESAIIEKTALSLSEYMNKTFESYEIIFSDDGSTDNSVQIVKDLGLPCVRVIEGVTNTGKGSAVRNAMLLADGDIRMFTDADLAYGTEVIGRAYDELKKNDQADVLIGSRNLDPEGYEGYTVGRRLISKLYIKILCVVGGLKLTDSQCGFKVFTADAANDIFSNCKVDGFAFDFEAILYATEQKKSIIEMPVKIINHRNSSVRPLGDAIHMLKDLKNIKKNIKSGR